MLPNPNDAVVAPPAKVIGTICANNHPRISHSELACPLCHVIKGFIVCDEQRERLVDEAHYRQSQLETANDNLASALDELKALRQEAQ